MPARVSASEWQRLHWRPAPGMARQVIQLIEGERHRIVDEAEEALIAAGGFDIYQRDAVMVRPVMHRLPAANRHGIKRATVAWRLMPVKPLYLIEMLGRVARFQSYDRRREGLDRQGLPERDRRDAAGARGCMAGAGTARRRAHAATAGRWLTADNARIRPTDPAAVQAGRRALSRDPRAPQQGGRSRGRWRSSSSRSPRFPSAPRPTARWRSRCC